MGFLSVLTIIFIVLKLLNVIAWSWLWVLSPLLVDIIIFILFIIITLVVAKR